MERSERISIIPNDQVLQVSRELWDLWVIRCINLPLLRGHWADSHKSLCGEATRCFHRYRWSVLTSCPLLCFLILLSQWHWKHEILDDQILRNLPSYSLQIESMICWVCQCKFRTISQERPMTARESASIIRNYLWFVFTSFIVAFRSPFNVVVHWHEDDRLWFLRIFHSNCVGTPSISISSGCFPNISEFASSRLQ